MPSPRPTITPEPVLSYVAEFNEPSTPANQWLRQHAAGLGNRGGMQVAPEVGALLTVLCASSRARRVVDVGTFTGYSALCLAQGLDHPAGKVFTFDITPEFTDLAREGWRIAGMETFIHHRIEDAREGITRLVEPIDLAFVDGDKKQYADYVDALVPRMSSGGLIVYDNTLWWGRVARPGSDDEVTVAIRNFNVKVRGDARVQALLLPVADGVTLMRVTGS